MAQDAIINRWDINGDVYDIQDAGRGRPLGVATLDENGRVPYTQLPESAVEFKGYWDASTNTPTLHDGTGTKGDLYYVDVAGTQDLGSGSQVFEVGDRVLYDGSIWKNMKSGGTDIEVYPTMADLEQDLPNLEDGTIVATEEGDNFTTVDTVQSGVFNPVTSNAVAGAITSALGSLFTLAFGNLPQNANSVTEPYNKAIFHGGFAQPSTLSNYPSATDWNSAGGPCSYFLMTYVAPSALSRVSQFCIMNYYNGTWVYRIWTRRRVDSTWFGWQQIL